MTEGETKRVPLRELHLFSTSSKIPISLLGSLVFFAVLWLLGFPKPNSDDLSYIGAGLNMAQGGDFSNPFLYREFTEHFAFYYPPIHSYVLAGWLKVFGISTASLTGFQVTMYFLCAASAIFVLRKHQSPVFLEWLTPLAVTNAFVTHGLRPEAMAATFIMVGFAMIECGLRNRILLFFAFLLMSLGGGTAPRMTLYAIALIFFAIWRMSGLPAKGSRERWVPFGLLLAAGLMSLVIFAVMIQFRFKEFWGDFHQNSQRVFKGHFAASYMTHLGPTQAAILLLFAMAAFFVVRQRPKDDLTCICMVIAPVLAIEFFTRFTGFGASRWHALLICLFLTASISKRTSSVWKPAPLFGLCLMLVLINCGMIVNIIGILSGQIRKTGKQEPLPSSLQGHTIVVDCAAARYYFNYQIPKGSIDFVFSLPFPHLTPVEGIANPADIYFVGPENVDLLKERGGLDYPPMSKWSPFGISRLSFYKYPQQIFIISPASCKGLRTDASLD